MKKNKILILSVLVIITVFTFAISIRAESNFNPFTIELQESNGDLSDYIEISIDEYNVIGSHLGIKINPEIAVDQNGKIPAWSMFNIIIFDKLGNAYSTNQSPNYTTSNPDYVPAFTESGSYTEVVWGYGHIWPNLGFYGTVYLPYNKLNNGSVESPTETPNDISKIRITHNSKSNSRQKMITHLFELVDATITLPTKSEKWIGDVLVLSDFDEVNAESAVNIHGQILDFSKLPLDSERITFSTDAKMFARKMTNDEFNNLKEVVKNLDGKEGWRQNYAHNGQKFSYTPFNNGDFKQGLKWEFGSYLLDYDSSLNSYGSLAIKASEDNWEKALGLTIWAKNPQSYPVSFNLEFSESEDGGLERWNLNNLNYRKFYAYNTVTQEEFAFFSLTVCVLPANFEGWIRISFSEFEVPQWSLNNPWSDGELDLSKSHGNIYLTSQFVVNDSVIIYFDNIGLYYEDFQVGKLFDRTRPSIRECLEMVNYKIGGRS